MVTDGQVLMSSTFELESTSLHNFWSGLYGLVLIQTVMGQLTLLKPLMMW